MNASTVTERLSKLTPRQKEALDLLCDGRTFDAVAAALGVSTQAIKSRVQRVSTKLGLQLLPAPRQLDIILGLYCPKESKRARFQIVPTQRQLEALLLLCAGKGYKMIAEELNITVSAVSSRIKLVSRKLGIEVLPAATQIEILAALVCPTLIPAPIEEWSGSSPQKEQPKPPSSADLRKLRAFLCYAKGDRLEVKKLYKRLIANDIEPWMDVENMLPGQTRKNEIPRAIRLSDVVIICLSQAAIKEPGYVHKDMKKAIDVASEQPEGVIFLIPARLDECEVPDNLRDWQAANLFEQGGFEKLVAALNVRRKTIP